MSSPQQHIFPPKPKKVITPLSPRPKNVPTDVTPLSPKEDITDAIESRVPEPDAPPVVELATPKAKKSPNRLLGATKA